MATYTGPSIVDYLKSVGQPSDYGYRSQLAGQYGIQGYSGSAEQNTQLLNMLRTGSQPKQPTASPAPIISTPAPTSLQPPTQNYTPAPNYTPINYSPMTPQKYLPEVPEAEYTSLQNRIRSGAISPQAALSEIQAKLGNPYVKGSGQYDIESFNVSKLFGPLAGSQISQGGTNFTLDASGNLTPIGSNVGRTQIVKPGDTLSGIAQRNGMTLDQLLQLNPQFANRPNNIQIGETINITPPAPGATPLPTVGPTVAPGSVSSSYQGTSIVDYLKSAGQPSDFNSRSQLAASLGIQGYRGTAEQNTQLLASLRGNKQNNLPQTPTAPTTPGAPTAPGQTPGQPAQESSEDIVTRLLGQYGITTDFKNFQTQPLRSFEEIYQDIYKKTGIDQVKSNIDKIIGDITNIDNELTDKIQGVNDNPWISEGLRSKKITQLQDKYESKKKALVNQLDLLQGAYDKGREEARFVATQTLTAFYKEREFQQDVLDNVIQRAEKQIEAQRKAKEFDTQVVEVYENGVPVKKLINSKTGEVIADLGQGKVAAEKSTKSTSTSTDNRKLTETEREFLSGLLGQVSTYQTKQEALADLESNGASIKARVGESGYKQIQDEIDRVFPYTPIPGGQSKVVQSTTTAPSSGVVGFFQRLFSF